MVRLQRSENPSPILVSLAVDPSVYLYSAEIEPDRRERTRLLARSRTENSASWTDQISFDDSGEEVRIGVNWVTLDSISPGRCYKATLSILDGAGALLAASPGFTNPMAIDGRIGPAADPTDAGQISIVIG
jgi:hypothetical protein